MQSAYERLKFYQNICEIRKRIYNVTEKFSKIHIRLISQMRDSARSAKQNIREGYRKGSAKEFAHFIKISAGSLSELEGDVDDCREDGLINDPEYNYFKDMFGKTNFQIDKYLDSLQKLQKENKWKPRFRS